MFNINVNLDPWADTDDDENLPEKQNLKDPTIPYSDNTIENFLKENFNANSLS